jgi:hypothetical protein
MLLWVKYSIRMPRGVGIDRSVVVPVVWLYCRVMRACAPYCGYVAYGESFVRRRQ